MVPGTRMVSVIRDSSYETDRILLEMGTPVCDLEQDMITPCILRELLLFNSQVSADGSNLQENPLKPRFLS